LPGVLRDLLAEHDAVALVRVPSDPLELLRPIPTLREKITQRLKSFFHWDRELEERLEDVEAKVDVIWKEVGRIEEDLAKIIRILHRRGEWE